MSTKYLILVLLKFIYKKCQFEVTKDNSEILKYNYREGNVNAFWPVYSLAKQNSTLLSHATSDVTRRTNHVEETVM
jgi:hypothetical protein